MHQLSKDDVYNLSDSQSSVYSNDGSLFHRRGVPRYQIHDEIVDRILYYARVVMNDRDPTYLQRV